ncbi:MAG: NAD-glutamate dehydrogenase [Myxococcales bacterium]|nr:NAD-glutamate dehydrogenase [Myxococcales bacterium]
MNPETDRLRKEILNGFEATLDALVPWFLSQMPAAYFADTDEPTRLAHLRAIAAARASDQSLHLTLRHGDGQRFTFLRERDYPGRLAEILSQVPTEMPLRSAKVHTSADGHLAIDEVMIGEAPRFDPSDPALAERAASVLEHAASEGLDREAVAQFLADSSADYVRAVTPLRAVRSYQRYVAVAGTDDTLVHLEPEVDPGLSRIVVTVGNATPRRMFERTAVLLGVRSINILRAFLDVHNDSGNGFVTSFTFIVRAPEGAIDPNGALWQRLAPELARMKWVSDQAVALDRQEPTLGLVRCEIASALASLAHQCLVKINPYAFSRERVLAAVHRHGALAARIADYLYDRSNPAAPLTDARDAARADELREAITRGADSDDARRVLDTCLTAVEKTLRTNLHLAQRYGLALRLDPSLIERADFTDRPFGLFFVHGQGFDGFHLRFRDIARGGVRVVKPASAAAMGREIDRLYDEVYGLAHAQQLKNKDIPEGGAKAVIVASPDVSVTRAFKGFADGLLDLLVGTVGDRVVDRYGRPETLYLGPDENITPELIEWVVARAARRGHPLSGAFMSSKPGAGINHKEFGVTSEGVTVFLDVALRAVGIDPRTQPFTVKLTGGPDGDVAGNMIKILAREYGQNARVVGIADGSGALEDPDGLDLDTLLGLVARSEAVSGYDRAKLGPRGRLTTVNEPDGARLRNTLHNRVEADAFVPSGGRPQTLNDLNWQEYLLADGRPSSKVIVEGANLFLTAEARKRLGEKGVLVVKDSSANKCGVICSSFEIVAAHLLSEAEFLAHKKQFVSEVVSRLRDLARREAELLFRERKHNGGADLPSLSVRLSREMNRAADAIGSALESLHDDDRALAASIVREHMTPTLLSVAGDRIDARLPAAYARSIVAKSLAARLVYREGLDWVGSLDAAQLGATALRYVREERAARALAAAIRAGESFDHENVATLIERAYARLATDAAS